MRGRKDSREEWSNFQKEFNGQSTPFAMILGCAAESTRFYRTDGVFVGLGPESTTSLDVLGRGQVVPLILRSKSWPASSKS